jgi:hypothetical protein
MYSYWYFEDSSIFLLFPISLSKCSFPEHFEIFTEHFKVPKVSPLLEVFLVAILWTISTGNAQSLRYSKSLCFSSSE